eukprot:SAG22_NODE_9140_length_608_cov_0.711198_1_plen_183_part_10
MRPAAATSVPLLLLLLGCARAAPAGPLTDSPLDDTVKDRSGNNHDGTMHETKLSGDYPDLSPLDAVLAKARVTLNGTFNAGGSYADVWARDTATFIAVAAEVNPPATCEKVLLGFLRWQNEDGELPGGYSPSKPKVPSHGTAPFPACIRILHVHVVPTAAAAAPRLPRRRPRPPAAPRWRPRA